MTLSLYNKSSANHTLMFPLVSTDDERSFCASPAVEIDEYDPLTLSLGAYGSLIFAIAIAPCIPARKEILINTVPLSAYARIVPARAESSTVIWSVIS